MSQISRDLTLLAPTAPIPVEGGAGVDRLPVGEVVRAEVLKLLGEDLFSIAIGQTKVSASSKLPLAEGDQFDVEVAAGANGRVNLRVIPPATTQGWGDGADDVIVSSPTESAKEGSAASAGRVSERLLEVARPGGSVVKLAEARPDLSPRLEKLLSEYVERPSGLGAGIESVREEVARVTRALPTTEGVSAKLAEAPAKLLAQVFGKEALGDPKIFAAQLGERFAGMVKGFEGLLARVVGTGTGAGTETTPARVIETNGPVPQAPSAQAPTAATVMSEVVARAAEAKGTAVLLEAMQANKGLATQAKEMVSATSAPPAESKSTSPATSIPTAPSPAVIAPKSETGVEAKGTPGEGAKSTEQGVKASAIEPMKGSTATVARGALEGDLKGQLLELRTQLQSVAASTPEAVPVVASALARTDLVIDQITGQQLKNVDGLNQFAHVEVPVDPKTGINEARLQIFYREKNGASPPTEEERFTVALFLNLSRLGDVLATVTGVDGTVSIGFAVERPEVKEILSATLEELRAGLMAAGQEGAMITVRTLPKNQPAEEVVWEEFLEQEPTPVGTGSGARLDREA